MACPIRQLERFGRLLAAEILNDRRSGLQCLCYLADGAIRGAKSEYDASCSRVVEAVGFGRECPIAGFDAGRLEQLMPTVGDALRFMLAHKP